MAPKTEATAAPAHAAVEDIHEALSGSYVINALGIGDLAIVEFSDFQCPYCGQFARETFPALKTNLIDTGKIRYVSLAYPLTTIHPYAQPAAIAAGCAAKQGKYWEMHDALFETQSRLEDAVAASFSGTASSIGLDTAAFEKCFTAAPFVLGQIKADTAEAKRLDVKSTPSFFIGRMRSDGGINLLKRITGAAPASAFVETIAALQKRE